jgi:hypothetical protein
LETNEKKIQPLFKKHKQRSEISMNKVAKAYKIIEDKIIEADESL